MAMTAAMKLTLLAASMLAQVLACDVDWDAFGAALMIFGILGGVLSLILVVLAALPLCCGMMKNVAKPIAGVAIAIGIVSCFLPAIGGPVAASGTTEEICNTCEGGCTEKQKEDVMAGLSAVGFLFAYTAGFGWFSLIMGIVAAALGCCVCCKCCKMKDEEGGQAA